MTITIDMSVSILRRSCVVGAIAAVAVLVGPASAHKDPVTPRAAERLPGGVHGAGQEGRPAVPWRCRDREEDGRRCCPTREWPAPCAIPWRADTHPQAFPKFQAQMAKFATLRDMINWCIEKPNQGEKIDIRFGRDEGLGSVHLLGRTPARCWCRASTDLDRCEAERRVATRSGRSDLMREFRRVRVNASMGARRV